MEAWQMNILRRQGLRPLAMAAVIAITSGQSGIMVLPTREGSPPQSPELGPSLRNPDAATCGKLRNQLAILVAAMARSLDEAHSFRSSYQGDIEMLRAFDSDWRVRFVSIKNELFTMATCEEFKAQWALALATWRDVFRYEKESLSELSADWSTARSSAAVQVQVNLVNLLADIGQ